MAKEMWTYLRLPDYAQHLGTIPVMRENIKQLCDIRLKKKNNKTPRLLFVVDDLDRCSHEGIVKVLEAIRIVLDLDNVIVVIAVDHHIALAALALHYQELSAHHSSKSSRVVARDYLAKIIHIPIRLPKPAQQDIEHYLNNIWNEMASDENKQKIKEGGNLADGDNIKIEEALVEVNINSSQNDERFDDVKFINKSGVTSIDSSGLVGKALDSVKDNIFYTVSDEQKMAFILWAGVFSFNNTRQLKRLSNSYELLRSFLPISDIHPVVLELPKNMPQVAYPVMLTLMLMEYLNNLEDRDVRKVLWHDLFVAAEVDAYSNQNLLHGKFVVEYRRLRTAQRNVDLVAAVEAFVLPAID